MKFSVKSSKVRALGFILTFLLVVLVFARFQQRIFSVDGYDPYYHMGMAKIVAEKGVNYHENWLDDTIFKSAYGNTLLGFHVLGASLLSLVPQASVFEISKMVIIALAFEVLALIYISANSQFTLFRSAIVIFLLGRLDVMNRIMSFRPQLLGFIFFFLTLFSLSRKRMGLTFVALLTHMLSHTSFPFSIIPVVIYFFVKNDWTVIFVLIFASMSFFLIHPDATSIVVRQQLQIVDIPFGSVNKGAEWNSSYADEFVRTTGGLLLILFFGVGYIVYERIKVDSTFLINSLSIPMFFYAAGQHGRFEANLLLLLGLVCTNVYSLIKTKLEKFALWISILFLIGSLILLSFNVTSLYTKLSDERELVRLSTPLWISENTHGSKIFNDWDAFPVLFYVNHYDYSYSAGLDPMYQYIYDPYLYEIYNEVIYTQRSLSERYEAITSLFNAKYVVLDDNSITLEDNPYFDLCFQGFHTVMRVK